MLSILTGAPKGAAANFEELRIVTIEGFLIRLLCIV